MNGFAHHFAAKLDEQVALYEQHSDLLARLRATVENELSDDNDAALARKWLADTPALFRTLRKHGFNPEASLSAMRDTAKWFAANNSALSNQDIQPLVQFLPSPRGTHLVCKARLADVGREDLASLKERIVASCEAIRRALAQRAIDAGAVSAGLQFVLVLDVQDAGLASLATDLISWYGREIHPRFPGLCVAALVVNYSWAYSGIWALIRHLLPGSALTRIFFVSSGELSEYLGAIGPYQSIVETETPPSPEVSIPPTALAATAAWNPYYGYPALITGTSASLRGGRRRKRDLARTLLTLWFRRWKRALAGWVGFFCIWVALVLQRRIARPMQLSIMDVGGL